MRSFDFSEIFENFSELLKERFSEQKKLGKTEYRVEEDTIRYFFFYAVTTSDYYKATDFWLEGHFYDNKNAELDTFINPKNEEKSIAIEFKYNRLNNEKSDGAKTDNAGNIFRDLNRLAHLGKKAQRKLFVYVANNVMKDYFSNEQSLWCKTLGTIPLEKDKSLNISHKSMNSLKNKSGCRTFFKNAEGDSFDRDFTVSCVFEKQIGEKEFLYIYEILN